MNDPEGSWLRDALPKGSEVNGFRIESILGRGGFGITYRVTDAIDQVFALKECFPKQFAVRQGSNVLPSGAEDEAMLADCLDRFTREAKALLQLSAAGDPGEGVVRVVTFFQTHGTAYLLMEYLAGESLAGLIKVHPAGLDAARLDDLAPRLLRAAGVVHDAGLLHRDIKPANILFRADGRPVLIDFGAVRTTGPGPAMNFTQIYSQSFAPIEQFSGDSQGAFSDIYALGATLYQAIGGRTIDAFTRDQALKRGKPDPLVPATEIGAGRYAPPLLRAIDAALTVEPGDRPQTVHELLALLGSEAEPPTVLAERVPAEPMPATPPMGEAAPLPVLAPARHDGAMESGRRSNRTAGLVFVAVACVAGLFALAFWTGNLLREKRDATLATRPETSAKDTGRAVAFDASGSPAAGPAPRLTGEQLRRALDAEGMVLIPAGRFVMGSNSAGTAGNELSDYVARQGYPQHEVQIASFALGKYDVTFDEWDACVADGGCGGYRPSDEGWGRGRRPVIDITWHHALAYIKWYSAKTGHQYRLPAEAEWEYAARAGTTTVYYWGDEIGTGHANCYGCGSQWDGKQTAPVGSFAPNPWGLYDMAGNTGQLTADCWNRSYVGAPMDGSAWTTGYCDKHVIRGGDFSGDPASLGSGARRLDRPTGHGTHGFRLARSLP